MTENLPVDKPNNREVQTENGDKRSSSAACSDEALNLMRNASPTQRCETNPQRPGQNLEGYPPAMTLRDGNAPAPAPENLVPADPALKQKVAELFNPNSSPEQKLTCVQNLADAGIKNLAYRDETGEHRLRLEKIPVGADGRSMVHLFGTDENGQQRTILRGISSNDGSYRHEKNPDNQEVDYYGMGKGLLDRPAPTELFVPVPRQNDAPQNNPAGDPRLNQPPTDNKLDCPNPYPDSQLRSNPFHKEQNPNELWQPPPPYRAYMNDNGGDSYKYSNNGYPDGDYGRMLPPGVQVNPDGSYGYSPEYLQRYQQSQGNPQYQQGPYDGNQGYRRPDYNPYMRGPGDQGYNQNPEYSEVPPPNNGYANNTGELFRNPNDRSAFYAHQNDGNSCSAFSMAMMAADWNTGAPPSDSQSYQWKRITHTLGIGYRGSLNDVARNLQEGIPGIQTKVYNYGMGRVGQQAMQDLNRELDAGHTAVAKIINPHTGNPHYIYIAGRTRSGEYVLGDPDRKNPHQVPISGQRLMHMMGPRDGFVAGWRPAPSNASRVQGTAANRYAIQMARNNNGYAQG